MSFRSTLPLSPLRRQAHEGTLRDTMPRENRKTVSRDELKCNPPSSRGGATDYGQGAHEFKLDRKNMRHESRNDWRWLGGGSPRARAHGYRRGDHDLWGAVDLTSNSGPLREHGRRDPQILCAGQLSFRSILLPWGDCRAVCQSHRVGGVCLWERPYQAVTNDNGHALHGGEVGFDQQIWSARPLRSGVELTLTSPDGDQGFPGNLTVRVRYTVLANALRIDYFFSTH